MSPRADLPSRWAPPLVALIMPTVLFLLAGCAEKCEMTAAGQMCSYETIEDVCAPEPPECKPKFMPGSLELRLSKPLPARVDVYRGENLEDAEKVQTLVPVSQEATATLSEGEYVLTALYVRGGDTTLVVATAEMEQDKLFLCSGKSCYEYERAEADLRLR